MTIFTVSHVLESWHINSYDVEAMNVVRIDSDIRTQDEAIKRAFIRAELTRPSKVMLVTATDDHVVAEFPE